MARPRMRRAQRRGWQTGHGHGHTDDCGGARGAGARAQGLTLLPERERRARRRAHGLRCSRARPTLAACRAQRRGGACAAAGSGQDCAAVRGGRAVCDLFARGCACWRVQRDAALLRALPRAERWARGAQTTRTGQVCIPMTSLAVRGWWWPCAHSRVAGVRQRGLGIPFRDASHVADAGI